MTDHVALPAPILNNDEGGFAHGVFTRRNPLLIDQIGAARPYDARQLDALQELKAEILNGTMKPLPNAAADAGQWATWGEPYFGTTTWLDAPFLWSESYFYRRLLEAVEYFAPGPWQGVDPFLPMKNAELTGEAFDADLATLDQLGSADTDTATTSALIAAVWGNRADLGFAVTGEVRAEHGGSDDLVVDHSEQAVKLLESGAGLRIAVIADNAGRELCADLVLVDGLLRTGAASTVELHLKPHPYYVSDATPSDLTACLRRMTEGTPASPGTAKRLEATIAAGRLVVTSHDFYVAPFDYRQLPDDLSAALKTNDLTILKGDLNYRRLVGDLHWPPTVDFDVVTAYFPTRVLALRTLKSDVLCGIGVGVLEELNQAGTAWRTDGSRGLVQLSR